MQDADLHALFTKQVATLHSKLLSVILVLLRKSLMYMHHKQKGK